MYDFNSSNSIRLPTSIEPQTMLSRFMTGGKGLSTTTITIIVVLILLLLGGLYFVYYYLPSIKASYKANNNPSHTAEEDAAGHSAELMLFYVDWCPHCKTAKPVWEDIKTEYENKTINGYHVMFTEINCTNENAEIEQLMNKYSIEGFPTIKLLKDGQIIEFDAKPTKANLEQFLNSVL